MNSGLSQQMLLHTNIMMVSNGFNRNLQPLYTTRDFVVNINRDEHRETKFENNVFKEVSRVFNDAVD